MNPLFASIQQSAISLLAAADTAPAETGGDTYIFIANYRYVLAAVAIIVLGILFLVWRARRRNRPLEVFNNETGRVQVAGSALAELIENAARQIGAASRPRVDFEHRGDKIHLHVRLKLAAGQRLPEFSESLKQHLSATLRDTFGLTNLGEITITVTGFKGNPLAEPADKSPILTSPKPADPLFAPAPVAPPTSAPAKPADSGRSGHDFFSTQ